MCAYVDFLVNRLNSPLKVKKLYTRKILCIDAGHHYSTALNDLQDGVIKGVERV